MVCFWSVSGKLCLYMFCSTGTMNGQEMWQVKYIVSYKNMVFSGVWGKKGMRERGEYRGSITGGIAY